MKKVTIGALFAAVALLTACNAETTVPDENAVSAPIKHSVIQKQKPEEQKPEQEETISILPHITPEIIEEYGGGHEVYEPQDDSAAFGSTEETFFGGEYVAVEPEQEVVEPEQEVVTSEPDTNPDNVTIETLLANNELTFVDGSIYFRSNDYVKKVGEADINIGNIFISNTVNVSLGMVHSRSNLGCFENKAYITSQMMNYEYELLFDNVKEVEVFTIPLEISENALNPKVSMINFMGAEWEGDNLKLGSMVIAPNFFEGTYEVLVRPEDYASRWIMDEEGNLIRKPETSEVPDSEVEPSEVPDEEVEPSEVLDEEVEPSEVPDEEVEPSEVPDSEVEPSEVSDEEVEPSEVLDEEVEPSEVPDEEVEPSAEPTEEVGSAESPEIRDGDSEPEGGSVDYTPSQEAIDQFIEMFG